MGQWGLSDSPVPGAIAAARLRALRMALLALHKALLDHERIRYEREHGRIESSGQALRLVMTDPWFAWLRPASALIVQADEKLDGSDGVSGADVTAFATQVRQLMQGSEYERSLQESPEVVMAHGRLTTALSQP